MKAYYILALVFLVGCGGGGGGSSSNKVNLSSDFATSDVRVDFILSGETSSEAKFTAYVKDPLQQYIELGGNDKLVAEVDGVNFILTETQETGGVYYTSPVVSANASEYTVKFIRDNVVISSLTATELPLPFTLTSSLAGEVIDVSWAPEADHKYVYLGEWLTCKNNVKTM
ncbi:hypothetical protein [Vibrio sp. SCSIO 43137]|uniref:hypothetical protein n=1 Tax=Vibrio sp. SCSIO 43137 TaxID=3021011 RepID=UPI00230741B6|nr:hypothetical protein [Vibrio sp. SCSIO 43137]WCE28346.1 hypothetical protein PK654_08105 [Vibrio sp. SCSIO 43137]